MNHEQMKNQKKAVIWDLDGTLINSVEYHWAAWRGTMTAEGIAFTYEEFVADFGKRNDEILRHRLRPDLPDDARWLERLRAGGWLQALGTSAPRGNIDAVFAATGMDRFFDAVMSSEEVRQGKPAPDVFLVAAEKMGVEPARCIVIEDAPAGVEAGKRAGMRTVGVLTTHDELEADLVVATLNDLPEDFFRQQF